MPMEKDTQVGLGRVTLETELFSILLTPFRHCLHFNTHLHYMPQCEVTPAGFTNCL